MKKTVYILLMMFGCLSNTLNAQESKAIDAIKNAPFIFDGTTCGRKFVKNVNGKDYVSYPIIINKIMKGDKTIEKGDTIELISEMPSDWNFFDDSLVYSPVELKPVNWINGIKLGGKTRGIYFLKRGIFQSKSIFELYLNKNDGYFRITWINKYNEKTQNTYYQNDVYGFSLSFDSFEAFNSFLHKNGLDKIKEDVSEYNKKKEHAYLEKRINDTIQSYLQTKSTLQILDFNPKTISSGTESILTITGKGFGIQRGNSQVIFKSSKDGGLSDVPYLNNYDYVDSAWTDSTIKIILPYSVKDKLSDIEYPLGSGKISLSKDNNIVSSVETLIIKYAVDNYNVPSSSDPSIVLTKIPFRQVTFSGSPYNYSNGHSREFYLDTSITHNPIMEAIVRKSLRDWSCETGINWVIVGTTENHNYIQDGKSVIFLDNNLIGDTLGYTKYAGISSCYDNSTGEDKRFMYAKEIDMGFARIPSNKSWDFDTISTNGINTNKYDFYEVVMHELGHAHYLGHINKNSDIMFYGSDYGPITAVNRRHVFTSLNSIEGGNYIIDRSLTIVLDGCENVNISTVYHPSYCGTMSSQDLENELFDISAYPNPFNSTVTLTFSNSEILNTNQLDYTITDISGKIIMKSEFKIGSDYKINLSNLNSGIYLLNITNGSNLKRTMKLIKQ